MKKFILIPLVLLFLVGVYFLVGTKKATVTNQIPQISTDIFLPLLNENVKAMEDENIDLYMKAVHPSSPSYAQSRKQAEELFAKYDLDVNLDSIKVISATNDEIVIEVVQTTKRIGGAEDFKNTKTTARHTLRKDGDTWKIYSTAIQDIGYIN